MKHTAGPWTKQTDGKGFFWIDKLTDDGGFTVCNCGDERDDNAEANAVLIAAAPELLETLKALVNTDPSHYDHYTRAMADANRAIQKAEGK